MPKPRPGGRSARIKAEVFDAADAVLAAKKASEVTMVDIAERAGVAASSLYRRWGDVQALLMDVATDRLMRDAPLPDTGALRSDLLTWAKSVAVSLASPNSSVFVRVFLATAPTPETNAAARGAALVRRRDEIEAMLERARQRGEPAPRVGEVIDCILAPLYLRMLFGAPEGEGYARALVDRLLSIGGAKLPLQRNNKRRCRKKARSREIN